MYQKERTLEQRVIRAAEAALSDHKYVNALDVLVGIGLLPPSRLSDWRQGRLECLEPAIQGNPMKISGAIITFQDWAKLNGLAATEARYLRRSRTGIVELQISVAGDPAVERMYRTHYFSPELSEAQRAKVKQVLEREPEQVVFSILRDSKCSQCGAELPSGSFLAIDGGEPLCLACAGMSQLEYLPAGNTRLTRRAGEYSSRKAVVVRFSRSRKRYEREGLLVETEALKKAEIECAGEAPPIATGRSRNRTARPRIGSR